jgi:PEP-CTERM motif
MRWWSVCLVGTLLVFGSIEARATSRQFDGSLSIAINGLSPIFIPGIGTAVVNGSSSGGPPITALQIPAGVFASYYILPVTDPGAAPIKGIDASLANAAGSFSNAGPHFGGTMKVDGFSKVCLFGPCTAAVANIDVPLNVVGVGGSAFVSAAVNLTVLGAPWTTGTVAIGTVTQMGGFASGPGGPDFQLVTPIFVSTNIGASAVVPTFSTLDLHLAVPEPTTIVLLGAGIVGLVAAGRKRAR